MPDVGLFEDELFEDEAAATTWATAIEEKYRPAPVVAVTRAAASPSETITPGRKRGRWKAGLATGAAGLMLVDPVPVGSVPVIVRSFSSG